MLSESMVEHGVWGYDEAWGQGVWLNVKSGSMMEHMVWEYEGTCMYSPCCMGYHDIPVQRHTVRLTGISRSPTVCARVGALLWTGILSGVYPSRVLCVAWNGL